MSRKNFWQIACLLAVMACFAGCLVNASWAEEKSQPDNATVTGKSTTVSGKDPNIKHDEGKNDKNATPIQPESKGGPKVRGGNARLHIDNHTKWYIKLYNNGDYIGTVAAYGDNYYNAEPGTHHLYGRAEFSDGSALTWGPNTYEVYGNFTWNLK